MDGFVLVFFKGGYPSTGYGSEYLQPPVTAGLSILEKQSKTKAPKAVPYSLENSETPHLG